MILYVLMTDNDLQSINLFVQEALFFWAGAPGAIHMIISSFQSPSYFDSIFMYITGSHEVHPSLISAYD